MVLSMQCKMLLQQNSLHNFPDMLDDFQLNGVTQLSMLHLLFVALETDPTVYAPFVVYGFGNCQIGIPTMAYWAAMLDPQTKRPTLQVLSEEEAGQIWDDILAEMLQMSEEMRPHIAIAERRNANVPANENNHERRGAAFFINNNMTLEPTQAECGTVRTELKLYQDSDGCPLSDESGNYLCPLVLWKKNHACYPSV
jgi:hypothetical protein